MNDNIAIAIIATVGGLLTTISTGIFSLLLLQRKSGKEVAVHVAEVAVKANDTAVKVDEIHGLVNSTHQEALREIIALRGLISRRDDTIDTLQAKAADRRSTDEPHV